MGQIQLATYFLYNLWFVFTCLNGWKKSPQNKTHRWHVKITWNSKFPKVLFEHSHAPPFCTICGYFGTTMVEVNGCNRNRRACKAQNTDTLALYRRRLPAPAPTHGVKLGLCSELPGDLNNTNVSVPSTDFWFNWSGLQPGIWNV